jgi:hypothetical protein
MRRICERCRGELECRPTAVEHCFCSQWRLSPALRTQLAKNYQDCLCPSCLQELGAVAKNTSFAPIQQPPKRDST